MLTAAPPAGRVVLFNGPPSSGKTTLARAVPRALGEPWFSRSLDDFRAGYLDEHWREDDGTLFDRVMTGHLGCLRALAISGNDLLAEAVITAGRIGPYVEALGDLQVTLVGIRCPYELAVEREGRRIDRLRGPLELPREAFDAIHAGIDYDLEVETSRATAEQIAGDVVAHLAVASPAAFARLAHHRDGLPPPPAGSAGERG